MFLCMVSSILTEAWYRWKAVWCYRKLVKRQETEGLHKREMVKLDHSLEWSITRFSINDRDEGISSHILKFADDTKVFQELRDEADCSMLQRDLDKLVTWAQKWQMDFNVKKCKVMHVGKQKNSSSYYTGGMKLIEEAAEKDLGVWISADMKCSQ